MLTLFSNVMSPDRRNSIRRKIGFIFDTRLQDGKADTQNKQATTSPDLSTVTLFPKQVHK